MQKDYGDYTYLDLQRVIKGKIFVWQNRIGMVAIIAMYIPVQEWTVGNKVQSIIVVTAKVYERPVS